MPKVTKTRNKRASVPPIASGSAGRLIVTYVDGSWTDNLAVERYVLEPTGSEIIVSIEVSARERTGKVAASREALREFVSKLQRVHTLQIGKPRIAEQLRSQVRGLEHSRLGVKLSAAGAAVFYPAGLAFGPDEVTLNLG